jgi:hypothetical protein
MYHFTRDLVADHRRYGLDKPPECFPKQPDVRRCQKQLGNWLRLPGRHPKRPFWSRVYDGFRWLEDDDAVSYLLDLTGDDPDLIPEITPAPSASPATSGQTGQARPPGFTGGNLAAYIAKYIRACCPNSSAGQGRDDIAYRLASKLVRDLRVSDDIALLWLERWDAKNNPPKGSDRLKEIIRSAHAYGQRDYGSGLAQEQKPRRGKSKHYTIHATVELDL